MKYRPDTSILTYFHEAKYDHPIGNKTWYQVPLNVEDIPSISYDENVIGNTLDELDTLIKNLCSLYTNPEVCLIGFSQGGNLIDTYLRYHFFTCNRAVIISGYDFLNGNPAKVDIPMMIVHSPVDEIVPYSRRPKYENMVQMNFCEDEPSKAHRMPQSKPQLRALSQFILNGVVDEKNVLVW